MAKNEKNVKAAELTDDHAIIEKLMAVAKAKGARAKQITYTVSRDGSLAKRIAPQAVKCLEALFASGETTFDETRCMEIINGANIATRQSKWRVFQFYRAQLINAGFLTLTDKDGNVIVPKQAKSAVIA